MRIIASGEFAESLLLCARGNPPDSFWTEHLRALVIKPRAAILAGGSGSLRDRPSD